MPYDSKKRPNFLGTEADRTKLTRLLGFHGVPSVADQEDNKIVPTTQVPSMGSQISGGLKIAGLIIAALAGGVIAVASGGVAVPGWLMSIATAIVAIAAPLGLASPGLKALQEKK